MPKFNFNLRDASAEEETPVNFVIRWGNRRLVYSTGEAIAPRHWCINARQRNHQRAKETKAFPEYPEFNERLDALLSTAKATFRTFLTDNDRDPEPGELKAALDVATGRTTVRRSDLLGYIAEFNERQQGKINEERGQPFTSTYHGRNRITLALLRDYVNASRKGARIPFTALDADFVEGFTKYLTTTKGHAKNTVGKYLRALRMFVNKAAEEGHEVNTGFRIRGITIPEERTEKVYLTENELTDFYRLDLTAHPRLDRARDLFLVGCWTGLRFGDLAALSPEHIEGERIRIRPSKTGKPVVIPLHPNIPALLTKYGGKFPPGISNQKLNDYVKEAAALVPSLQQRIPVGITKGGIRREVNRPKWEQVSSHTARRSFASNLYRRGVASQTIMSVTGHRTEGAFLRYIRLDGEQHADMIANVWCQGVSMLKAV